MDSLESQEKYCSHCGSKIPADAKYCPRCGSSQESLLQPAQEKNLRGYAAKNSFRIHIILTVASMAVFLIGLLIGSLTSLSHSDAESIINEFLQNIGPTPTTLQIALNNITLCMIFLIPAFGTLFMAIVSYNTGIVLSAAALISPSATQAELYLTTLTFPWTWLELLAYSLASAQGISLLIGALTGRFRQEAKQTLKTAAICILLLLIGAVIEANALKSI